MKTTKSVLALVTVAASALLWAACSASPAPGGTTIDRDDIAGAVTKASSPEADI